MKKYRKKPVIIEAEQWFPNVKINGVITSHHHTAVKPYVETLEGNMSVNPGDWIIRGVEGELYPCKDSVFQKTYKLVENDPKDEKIALQMTQILKWKKENPDECLRCKMWDMAAIENGYRGGMCEECFNRSYVNVKMPYELNRLENEKK